MKNVNMDYVILAIVGFLAYKYGRKDEEDHVADDVVEQPIQTCQSVMQDAAIKSSAAKLKSLFDSWYIGTNDEAVIVNIWRQLPDACAVKKLYSSFGVLSTYGGLYQGDLGYFMRSRLTETSRDQARGYSFGQSDF